MHSTKAVLKKYQNKSLISRFFSFFQIPGSIWEVKLYPRHHPFPYPELWRPRGQGVWHLFRSVGSMITFECFVRLNEKVIGHLPKYLPFHLHSYLTKIHRVDRKCILLFLYLKQGYKSIFRNLTWCRPLGLTYSIQKIRTCVHTNCNCIHILFTNK